MTDAIIIQFCLTMLAAQFSPGPDMLLLLKCAVNHHLSAGLLTVLGIVAGLSIHCSVAALGLSAVIQGNEFAFRGLMLAGALYLGWIGSKLLNSLREEPEPATAGESSFRTISAKGAFLQGFLTNITNVKAFLFLTSFIASGLRDDSSAERKWLLVGIIIGQALIGWSLFLWLLQRPILRNVYQKLERPLNGIFGVLLLLISSQMAVAALQK